MKNTKKQGTALRKLTEQKNTECEPRALRALQWPRAWRALQFPNA